MQKRNPPYTAGSSFKGAFDRRIYYATPLYPQLSINCKTNWKPCPERTLMPTKGTFVIPVSNGIFAHRDKIGASIWVFLWLIDRSTYEVPTADGQDVEGLVLG